MPLITMPPPKPPSGPLWTTSHACSEDYPGDRHDQLRAYLNEMIAGDLKYEEHSYPADGLMAVYEIRYLAGPCVEDDVICRFEDVDALVVEDEKLCCPVFTITSRQNGKPVFKLPLREVALLTHDEEAEGDDSAEPEWVHHVFFTGEGSSKMTIRKV